MAVGYRYTKYCVLLVGMMSVSTLVHAECRVNSAFGRASHHLVNGVWRTPPPEVVFKVPADSLGDGGVVWPASLSHAGSIRTLPDHVRFRLLVNGRSSTGVGMYFNSSSPLSCVGCAGGATIPMSKIGWVESNSRETRGSTPGNGQLNNGVQGLVNVAKRTHSTFNLKFYFANDQVYPAGIYTGEFVSQGIPQ